MTDPLLPSYLAEGTPFRYFIKVILGLALTAWLIAEFIWKRHVGQSGPLRLIRVYALSIAAPILLIGAAIELVELYDRVLDPAVNTLMSPNALWAALLATVVLYWLRGVAPVFYGALEIMVGVLAISLAANYPAISPVSQLLAVAAGVYIVIRGLDNIDKGLFPSFQLAWRAFWQWPKKQLPLTPER